MARARPRPGLRLAWATGIPLRNAVRGLEDADAVGWPVGEKRVSDDPASRDGTPESAVVGVAAVVAHHEPHAARHADRGCKRAGGQAGVRVTVGFSAPVPDHVPVLDCDDVTGSGNDSFDERLVRPRVWPVADGARWMGSSALLAVGALWGMEHNNLA